MLSIKNSKGLSKSELLKINDLFSVCLGCSNDICSDICYDIDTSNIITSNIPIHQDLSVYDTYNVLLNDYVIYEMQNGSISGFLGLVTSDKIAMVHQLHMLDTSDIKLGKKLIGMVQMVTKHTLLVVISKNNTDLIEFYKNINFNLCALEDIDYDVETEVVMMKI